MKLTNKYAYDCVRIKKIGMFLLTILFISICIQLFTYDSQVYTSPSSRITIYGKGCYRCFLKYVDEFKSAFNQLGIIDVEVRNLDEDEDAVWDLNHLYEVLNVPKEMRGNLVVSIDDKFLFEEYVPINIIVDFIENHEHEYQSLIVFWDENKGLFKVMDENGIVSECWIEKSVRECVEDSRPSSSPALFGLVLVSGLIDGINPCAFAVMLFFIAVIFVAGTSSSFKEVRRRILLIGVVYIVAVFMAYITIGLTLIKVFDLIPFPHLITRVGAIFLILMAVFNIKDYFWPGHGFSLGIPGFQWENIRRWMHKLTIPAAFAVGLMVGFFEFPCTGGIYIAILSLLADKTSFFEGLGYLLLYNVMFVAPLVTILLITSTKQIYRFSIERWRRRENKFLRLESGLFMLFLGVILFIIA